MLVSYGLERSLYFIDAIEWDRESLKGKGLCEGELMIGRGRRKVW